jgi:ribosomal protein S12 methylthiotransferase accessory factor
MSDEMIITFPGGKRVDAEWGGVTFRTDQPVADGDSASAPAPFEWFLASLGTCAGYYALEFCAQRGIPTDGLRLVQRVSPRPDGSGIGRIEIRVELPASFPKKYREAIARAASACAVKKVIESPPAFEVRTVSSEP